MPQLENTFVLEVAPGTDIAKAVVEFMSDPRVAYAEPNYIYHLISNPLPVQPFIPDDIYITQDGTTWSEGSFGQSFHDLFGLDLIQALEGWDSFFNINPPDGEIGAGEVGPGEGVLVGIIDSGIDVSHPDIAANVWQNDDPVNGIDDDGNGFVDDVNGYDFVDDTGNSTDPNGHGTHVSGTVAAVGDNAIGVSGVAPSARVMNARGFGPGGSGSTETIALAVLYAVDNQADILSNSWGGSGFSQVITDVFDYAAANGVLSIAAAGNGNKNVAGFFPADIDNVLSVAATDHDDLRASFSNFGELVDVAAPGVDVLSLNAHGGNNTIALSKPGNVVDTDYLYISGTSMACPHVSGAAAVLMSYFPGDSPSEIWGRLRGGAQSIDGLNPGFEGLLGTGRINLLNSLGATPVPDLEFVSLAAAGLIPGSQGAITAVVRNFWAPSAGVSVDLTSSNPLVTIDLGSVDFGPIGAGEFVSNDATPFLVTVSAAAQLGDELAFTATATSLEGDVIVRELSVKITIYSDVTEAAGVVAQVGLAPRAIRMQDYDGDGITDLRVDDVGTNLWYRGLGDGTFVSSNDEIGIDAGLPGGTTLFFDADNDGDEDFLIGRFGSAEEPATSTHLYLNNGDGTATEVTTGSGLESTPMLIAVVIDYNKDGWNDILGLTGAAITEGGETVGYEPLYLMRNNGDLTFTDVRASVGLPESPIYDGLGQIVVFDATGLGDPSILFLSRNPEAGISFWRDSGGGTFVDATSAFADPLPAGSWGAAVGDYDGDGDLDVHLTSDGTQYLFQNNGSQFTNVTAGAGDLATVSVFSLSPGNEFLDYDNDGDLDLFLTRQAPGVPPYKGPALFENLGDGTFSDVSDVAFPVGFTPTFSAAGFGDLNGDGALDIYVPQSNFFSVGKGGLLQNNLAGANHWLKIAFDGSASARDAYGVRVEVTAGGETQLGELRSSAHDTSSLHFGLGDEEIAEGIFVRWPSRRVQYLANIPGDQRYTISEGAVQCPGGRDDDGDGICNIVDNCTAIQNPDQIDSNLDGYGNSCDPDYDQDNIVSFADFAALSGAFLSGLGDPNYNPDIDHNGDDFIDYADFYVLSGFYGGPPGPSGLACAGTIPCAPVVCGAGPDTDGDGICDADDNCIEDWDPLQLDENSDGYGNVCDADYDDSGTVAFADFGALSASFLSSLGDPNYNPLVDVDDDGYIGWHAFKILTESYGDSPGPSGLACAGTVPCPSP